MRLRLLLSAGVLLAALLRGPPCGALLRRRPAPAAPAAPAAPGAPGPQPPLRAGEELLLRLAGSARPAAPDAAARAGGAGGAEGAGRRRARRARGGAGRRRRAEEPPISLDLTFHLLRQVLEMARAEQLAQRAHSNRRLMELAGK